MDIKKLKRDIESTVLKALDQQEIENPKFECKREWYRLKLPQGISEFIKDASAMANTVGLDGYIVIGVDTKSGQLYNTGFSDSGLKDVTELYQILIRNLSNAFAIDYYVVEVNGYKLGVLHIPPSREKPHVINLHTIYDKNGGVRSNEQNRILIRKATGIYPANKYDIDFMYYDRKNVLPEYELHAAVDLDSLLMRVNPGPLNGDLQPTASIMGVVTITLENTGFRTISIRSIVLEIAKFEDDELSDRLTIELDSVTTFIVDSKVIEPGKLRILTWSFTYIKFNHMLAGDSQTLVDDIINNRNKLIIKEFKLYTTNNAKMNVQYGVSQKN